MLFIKYEIYSFEAEYSMYFSIYVVYIHIQDGICLTFHFCCGLLNIRQSISVLIRYFEMWMEYKIETEKNWKTAGNSIILFSLLTLFVLSVWNRSKGISVLYIGSPNENGICVMLAARMQKIVRDKRKKRLIPVFIITGVKWKKQHEHTTAQLM